MNVNIDETVRKNLSKVLKAKNILPIEMSEKMDIKRSTFYTWITGTRKISIRNLKEIGDILGVDFRLFLHPNLEVKKEFQITIKGTEYEI